MNNERWLNSYEANFLNSYQNKNPFFKKPASHRNRQDKGPASYADAVKSRPRPRQRIQRPDQSLRNLLQELTFKLNGPRSFNRRRFQQNNYRENRSNNSQFDSRGDVVDPDALNFLQEDHN